MKLKSLFAVLPAICVIFSCQKPEIASVLTIDPEDASVNCLANQTKTVTVTSTEAWTVTPQDEYSWVEVTPTSGKGNAEVTFKTIEKNTNSKNRTAYFTFSNGVADDVEFTLKQLKYDESIDVPDDPDDPDAPVLTISETSGAFTAEGGSMELTVNSTEDWALESNAEWLTATPASGKDGDKVTVTVAANADTETRTGEITFTSGELSAKYTASQSGTVAPEVKGLSLKSGKPDVIVGHHEGETSIQGATFEWEIENNGQPFAASVTPNSGATLNVDVANSKITLTVPAAEIKDTTYTWEINANIADPGDVEPLILVARQQCYSNHLDNTDNAKYRILAKEVTSEESLTSGIYRITDFNDGWRYCHFLNYHDTTTMTAWNGYCDNVVDYTGGTLREGLDGDNGMIYAVLAEGLFKFTSTGENNSYYIRPIGAPDLGLGKRADGTLGINYACRNSKWTITKADYGWVLCCDGYYINAAKGSTDSANLQTSYTFSETASTPSKNLHIRLYKECRIVEDMVQLDATSKEVAATESTAEVQVTANVKWTATSDSDWATVSPASGITGQTKVTVTAAANNTASERTATITFTAGTATATLTVKQAAGEAAADSIELDATSKEVAAEGGDVTVKVTANTNWTVSSDSDWAVAGTTSGSTGDTNETVTVSANATTSERSAVLTFTAGSATAKLTITQAAGSATPDPEATAITLASGTQNIFVANHSTKTVGETTTQGGDFEWEVNPDGQEWTASIYTNASAQSIVAPFAYDTTTNKITLSVPTCAVSAAINVWTIVVLPKDAPASVQPLVLTVNQQAYSYRTYKKYGDATGFTENIGYKGVRIDSADDFGEGYYRIMCISGAYSSGCYQYLSAYQSDESVTVGNSFMDKGVDYYSDYQISESIDGSNGILDGIRSDYAFEFTQVSGKDTYYIRPIGTKWLGLGVKNGALAVGPEFRDNEWTVAVTSNGWNISCGSDYIVANSNSYYDANTHTNVLTVDQSSHTWSSSGAKLSLFKFEERE